MNALLLVQGHVVDPANRLDAIADVLIQEGKSPPLGPRQPPKAPLDAPRLDVSGLVVCPGLIDAHVHLREPGQSAKETIATDGCGRAWRVYFGGLHAQHRAGD